MNIAVYCASRPGSDPAFARDAYEVGRWIGSHGHTLVYGGSNTGLMGRVADGCLDAGGEVIGVIPGIDEILARQNPRLSRVIFTKDMADRRSEMIRLSDGFIALPGGIGTLDEFSEVLCLNAIGALDKPLVLLGTGGYYEAFRRVIEIFLEEGMADEAAIKRLLITESIEEAGRFLKK